MPRLIGIDLGAHAIKATVLRTSGRKTELEGRHWVKLEAEEGELPPMGARLAALAELVEEHPEWQQPANGIALGYSEVSTRLLSLPFTDKSQVERTLEFAVEAEVPFDLEQMVLGWRVLGTDQSTDVLVALARRDQLQVVLEAMHGAQVDPRYVHVDADVAATHAEVGLCTAVIDVGHAHSTVTVAVGGVAQQCRRVDVGGWAISLAIAEALDIGYAEAEALKCGEEPGSAAEDAEPAAEHAEASWEALPEPARKAADDVLGVLLAEIRTTLVAAEDSMGTGIEEVRLCGGSARLAPLAGYLAADLGVPVRRVAGLDDAGISTVHGMSDALAARLDGRTPGAEIDLRRGELAYRGGVDVLRATVVYGGAGAAFFMLAALVIFGVRYAGLSSELSDTEQRIKDLVVQTLPHVDPSTVRDTTMATAIMREEVTRAQERARFLGSAGGVPPTVDTLADLTRAFPKPEDVTVDVTELTITPSAVTFTAETDSYASADKVEAALQAHERFSAAVKGDERTSRDKVSFPVSIPLEQEDEEGA